MATKKPTKKPQTFTNPSFRGFLNITLSDEDRAIIKATEYASDAYYLDVEKWIDSGYKFTFSYDDYNHCYQVIGTPMDKDHVDYGIMLAARGSTPVKAMKQWVYMQVRLVGDSTWTENLKPPRPMELDD